MVKTRNKLLVIGLISTLLLIGCGKTQVSDKRVFRTGTSVFGIDVSGKEFDEVLDIAMDAYPNYVPDFIPVTIGDNKFEIDVQKLDFYMEDIDKTLEDFRNQPELDIQNKNNYTANWFVTLSGTSIANTICEEGEKQGLKFNDKLLTYCHFLTTDDVFSRGIELRTDCLDTEQGVQE